MSFISGGHLNDFELLDAARVRGDEEAWREIQSRHGPQVSTRGRRMLRGGRCCDPSEHLRDVSQEVWKQLWAYAPTVLANRKAETEGLGGLLHTMCRNEVLRHLERDCLKFGRVAPYGDGDGAAARPEGDILGFPDVAERVALAQRVRREAENVNVKDFSTIFKLREEGFTHAQIAARLDCKEEKVRRNYSRGLLELKRRLKDLP